jgi:calcineurin-like phosphoesterase family protein
MSQRIFFTSDTHAGHANVIRYDNAALEPILGRRPRPYRSVEEMDAAMVALWNSVVGPKDVVYHLGDMCLHKAPREAIAWTRQLNGKIRLLILIREGLVEPVAPEHELKVEDPDADSGSQMIMLSHYAHRVWNKSHHGSWHLFGHSHGSLPDDPASRSFDVGCMLFDMKPIPYARVKSIMSTKRLAPVDHHG